MARFDYLECEPGVFRPLVPVQLMYGLRTMQQLALADSGADICLFDLSVAEYLAIDLRKARRGSIVGIGGAQEVLYGSIRLQAATASYEVEVGFTELPGVSYGVVGQTGFFDRFLVTFDRARRIVRLA